MKWSILAAATLALAAAVPARAQIPYRHFEQPYWDTNRSDRIVYYPVVKAVSGPRPGTQPYSVAQASWFEQRLGARDVKPNAIRDGAAYQLDEFTTLNNRGQRTLRVVITRHGGDMDTGVPQLRVTHDPSRISVTALPRVSQLSDGVRYTYTITPPSFGFTSDADVKDSAQAPRYQLDLLAERNLRVPDYVAKAPTFGGRDWKDRSDAPPPQLPVEERVAGRRIEYRSGRVISDKGQK